MPVGKTFHALSQSGTGGQAEFTVDLTTIEPSDTVQFTDLTSSITPTSWEWDFGDGEKSTLQNPTHRYKFSGQFTVTLKASDGVTTVFEEKQAYINCSSPDWIVTIDTRITYDPIRNIFAATQADNEFRLQIRTNITGVATSATVDWGDGNQDIIPLGGGASGNGVTGFVHAYTTPGIYKVKLLASSASPVAPVSWPSPETNDNIVKIIEFNNWGSGISYNSGTGFGPNFRNWRVIFYANDSPANTIIGSGLSFQDTTWVLTPDGCYIDNIFSGLSLPINGLNAMFFGAGAGFNANLDNIIYDSTAVSSKICTNAFNGCTRFNQPLSHWIMDEVTSTQNMFFDCRRFNQDISMWNVSSVTNMTGMFREALTFNQDISSWDVSSVGGMSFMFFFARSFNQDLSSWNVNNVSNFQNMFADASSFNQNLGSWQLRTAGINNMVRIFSNSGMSTENYTDTIVGWANYVFNNGGLPANVSMTFQTGRVFTNSRPGGANFADAQAARAYLATQGWTISGDIIVA